MHSCASNMQILMPKTCQDSSFQVAVSNSLFWPKIQHPRAMKVPRIELANTLIITFFSFSADNKTYLFFWNKNINHDIINPINNRRTAIKIIMLGFELC